MAWHKIVLTGLVASVAIVGCTVTTGTDKSDSGLGGGETDSGSGTGGAKSTGGASSAGGSSAGGAKSTGGATSTGGAGGDVDSGPPSDCDKCLTQYCAEAYSDCGKDKDCAQVGNKPGEFQKIQECMFKVTGDASVAQFTEGDLLGCAADTANVGGVPSDATQALVTCARGAEDASTQPCTERCYGAIVPYK